MRARPAFFLSFGIPETSLATPEIRRYHTLVPMTAASANHLPTYLPTCLPTYLLTYLPTYLHHRTCTYLLYPLTYQCSLGRYKQVLTVSPYEGSSTELRK
ncbi:hypothetical protein GGS21DRAFT_337746 [Xylaria nigripes]|nr:hypothetical protein GGS21DRAFT_337746 [Xylaria nigripes]